MAVTSSMLRVVLHACAFGAPLLASSIVLAQQAVIVAYEGTDASAFRSQAGRVVTFVCPAMTTYRDIWGTDVYSYDSPICTAAVHAGTLQPGVPGQVTIRVGAATELFRESVRNNVTSLPYGPADTTYSFIGNNEPGQIDWHTTYNIAPDDFHAPITVLCPANGSPDALKNGSLIGTNVYRWDSAICVAAVHAGVITLGTGGTVTVTLQPKQEVLEPSERNGVSSDRWSSGDYRSYPQPYSVTSAVRARTAATPRLIRVEGFTAEGSARPPTEIVPRIVALTGFTAVGTARIAQRVTPRVVSVPGWTGTGPRSARN